MAEDTASLVQFYAREGAGGAISLEKRVEASWNAACQGQEVLYGTQYVRTVADPAQYPQIGGDWSRVVRSRQWAAQRDGDICVFRVGPGRARP